MFDLSPRHESGQYFFLSLDKYITQLEAQLPAESAGDSQSPPGEAEYSWLYNVGGELELFSGNLALDGPELVFDLRAWLAFLSSQSPLGYWNFLASAFHSELRPRLGIHFKNKSVLSTYFRHSCKHDLDQFRRLVIYQHIGMGLEMPIVAADRRLLPRMTAGFDIEYRLPAILPDQPEVPGLLPLRIAGEAELLRFSDVTGLWARVYGYFPGFAVPDYALSLGYRWGKWSVYASVERISDPLISFENPGLRIISLGIHLDGMPGR